MFAQSTILDAVASLAIAAGFTLASYGLAWAVGADVSETMAVEFLGVFFNFACVWSTARQNPWAWVFGAVGAVFLGILFWNIALYSSMTMSLAYYLPIQFFGLWRWLAGGADGNGVKISRSPNTELVAIAGIMIIATGIWAMFIGTYTDATFANLDAMVFGASIVAQYLLTNKRVESWALWGAINVASVYLYWKTGASVLAIQYSLFFIHAVYGGVLWTREYRGLAKASV